MCPRSPRDPGVAPVEKKKKGKRRNQEVVVPEGPESDDAASVSTLTLGGDDSQDPLDHTVSGDTHTHTHTYTHTKTHTNPVLPSEYK